MQITSIKTKVLLLFLTITCVVVVFMALLMQFGFKQGFSQYKKSLEKELNDRLVMALESHYADQQNWQLFSDDPRAWHELIFASATEGRQNGPIKQGKRKSRELDVNRSPKKHPGRNPPPRRHAENDQRYNHPEISRVLPSYSLYNEQQQVVIGRSLWSDEKSHKIPVKFQNQVVGYVVYDKQPGSQRKQDQQFNKTFVWLLIMIAGVMILVALLFTVPVAKSFTRPISALNQATKKAAAGDFKTKIHIERTDELGQLGQNFNMLTSTLASHAEIQKRMMADISHELRTPVAVLLAQIEAIQDGIHQADDKNLKLLHNQVQSLHHLINDIHQLSVTELGSLQYSMQPIDLLEVITQVKKALGLSAAEKQINIDWQPNKQPMLVLGDKNRLRQLVSNLLNNSIKYTDHEGRINISAFTDNATEQQVITIADSQPGLLPHEIEQMFDRMYRADGSRNKRFGGSGLGLAIAKNIVEAHDGHIAAEPSELGGICITVRIPKNV